MLFLLLPEHSSDARTSNSGIHSESKKRLRERDGKNVKHVKYRCARYARPVTDPQHLGQSWHCVKQRNKPFARVRTNTTGTASMVVVGILGHFYQAVDELNDANIQPASLGAWRHARGLLSKKPRTTGLFTIPSYLVPSVFQGLFLAFPAFPAKEALAHLPCQV